jgi:hypothetical protein
MQKLPRQQVSLARAVSGEPNRDVDRYCIGGSGKGLEKLDRWQVVRLRTLATTESDGDPPCLAGIDTDDEHPVRFAQGSVDSIALPIRSCAAMARPS